MKTKRIGFYSGPGVGKSTTAARLFSELKIEGQPVELVTEYIKEWAWLKICPCSFDQLYVFAKQIRKEDVILRHDHTHVITDSPIFLQLAYMKRSHSSFYESCADIALLFEEVTPSLHVFLKRSVPYSQEGRYENYQQALEMDELVKETLVSLDLDFIECDVKNFDEIKEKAIQFLQV